MKQQSLATNSKKKRKILFGTLIPLAVAGAALAVVLPLMFCKSKESHGNLTFNNESEVHAWARKHDNLVGYNWRSQTNDVTYQPMLTWIDNNMDKQIFFTYFFIMYFAASGVDIYPVTVQSSDSEINIKFNLFGPEDSLNITFHDQLFDCAITYTGFLSEFYPNCYCSKAGYNNTNGNWFLFQSSNTQQNTLWNYVPNYWSGLILPIADPS